MMLKLAQFFHVVLVAALGTGVAAVYVTHGQEASPPRYPSTLDPDLGEDASPMALPKPKPDGRVTLELTDGSRLVGRPSDLRKITLETQFGKVDIAFQSVLGIRLPNSADTSSAAPGKTTFVFRNGDVLTGELRLDSIQLKSVWGDATIALEHATSIINSAEPHFWRKDTHWHLEKGFMYPPNVSPYGPAGAPAAPADFYAPLPPALPPAPGLPVPMPPTLRSSRQDQRSTATL